MNYVKHFNINGVDTKQVACIELHGKPNAATEGHVGVLGIDVDSTLHDVYKCVAVNGSIYTWELLSSGLSIMSATITGEGASSLQFPYETIRKPEMYVIKRGDLILDSDGYLYQVSALNTTYCDATYTGTRVVAFGYSAYDLAVKNGYEGSEEEWLASLKGEQGEQGIQGEPGNTPYVGNNGNWWIAGIDTGANADKGTRSESGWYNGTGAGEMTLTFSFVPRLILIVGLVWRDYDTYYCYGLIDAKRKVFSILEQTNYGETIIYRNPGTVSVEGTTVTLSTNHQIHDVEGLAIFNIFSETDDETPISETSGFGYYYYAFG